MSSKSRPLAPALLAATAGALVACALPSEACGCTPSRSAAYVIGTLTERDGAPVVGARVYLSGIPEEQAATAPQLPGGGDATTDGAGGFRGRAYSYWAPGVQQLRAAVVRPPDTNIVYLSAGRAPFRFDGGRLDTVRVALRLP